MKKNKKSVRIVSAVLSLLLLFSSGSVTGLANDEDILTASEKQSVQALRDKQSELDKKIAAANENINALKEDKEKKQAYAEELTVQLNNLNEQIYVLNESIGAYQTDIDALETNIAANQTELEKIEKDKYFYRKRALDMQQLQEDTLRQLTERIRFLYMTGESNELEALLDAGSLYTFLARVELMNGIAEHDQKLIETYISSMNGAAEAEMEFDNKAAEQQQVIDALEKDSAALEEEKGAVVDSRTKLEEVQQSQNSLYLEAMTNIDELDKKSMEYSNLVEIYNNDRDDFDAEIEAIIEKHKAEEAAKKAAAEAENSDSSSPSPSSAEKAASTGFISPLSNYSDVYVSSGYGGRTDPATGEYKTHYAVDLCCSSGTSGKTVVAAAAGTVVTATSHSSYGNYVLIDHGNDVYTLYAHNSSLVVSEGQSVSQGQTIAYAGATGYATGAHVHFEVRVNGSKVNPLNYISP